uniref:Secreted protein n=1 Tax=Rhizophora mucronata TaxID=61149 RepID=A0A2P2R0T3_RHIMU
MLPLRVSLAASFWFGVRLCGAKSVSTWQNLRRLEELSGVPAKLIAAVELKLERVSRVGTARPDTKEGWAESF